MKKWNRSLPKILGVVALSCSLQFSASASSIKLIDILANESGLGQYLSKFGIRGSSATQVKSYVNNSIASLYKFGSAKPSAATLRRHVANLPTTSSKDKRYKDALLKLLAKPESELTEADIVNSINSLIYLANRHGKNSAAVLACTACVSESLSAKGFKFTLETMNNSKSKEVLTKILPSNPRSLTNYINTKLAKHRIGDLSKSGKLVASEEEKALGLFLGLKEVGSKEQRDLIRAIESVSTNSAGKINIVDTANPHKLWKLFSEDISESEMEGWTKLLDEVAANSKGVDKKRDVFFEILEKRAKDSPELQDRVQILKNKNCFFQ